MSSTSHENHLMMTILIRMSNSRHRAIERQRNNGYIPKQISLWELFAFSFIPCVTASTILAPFNRLKVIQQVKDFQYKDSGSQRSQMTNSNVFKSIT